MKILINGLKSVNFFKAQDILPENFSEHYQITDEIIVALQSAIDFYQSLELKTNRNMKNKIRREVKKNVKSSEQTNC